jgi:hypothetical protein
MRNRRLHDALRDFALDAASHLTAELRAGHEIPFDLMEEPRRRAKSGPALYHYTPLTAQFIEARWKTLRTLPAFEPAARALGSGAENYLRVHGDIPGDDAEPALRAMLERLYEDATNFEFPEERFDRVYAEVEHALFENTQRAAVIAPLPGLRLESDRVDLGDGMALVAGETFDAPAEAVWGEAGAHVLCVLERDVPGGDPPPVSEAKSRFEWLLASLRLFKSGGLALAPLGWSRTDEGAWRALPLARTGGLARGASWTLAEGEEAELREFLGLLSEARVSGRVGWALDRFQMGCGRAGDIEALTDYLLALRGLLDGMDDAGRAALTLRLAALCADEPNRKTLQRRVELAIAIEEFAMAGGEAEDYLERVGSTDSARALVLEVEESLRALLRDVVCGFLEQDLKGAADDILVASGEPIEIKATDIRRQREAEAVAEEEAELEPQYVLDPAPPPPPPRFRARAVAPPPVPEAIDDDTQEREPAARIEHEPLRFELADRDAPWELEERVIEDDDLDAGVTPSADWNYDLDDDAASYAGPV